MEQDMKPPLAMTHIMSNSNIIHLPITIMKLLKLIICLGDSQELNRPDMLSAKRPFEWSFNHDILKFHK